MSKTIKLPRPYSSDSILALSTHDFADRFSYVIRGDLLTITRTDTPNPDHIHIKDCTPIHIGSSRNPLKILALPKHYPPNTVLKIAPNPYSDSFSCSVIEGRLYVARTDAHTGWDYNHKGYIFEGGWNHEYRAILYEKTILHYPIGSSKGRNTKMISSNPLVEGFTPEGCLFTTQKSPYHDNFHYHFEKGGIRVHRYDKPSHEGWDFPAELTIRISHIPKTIFQTHHQHLPDYVKEKIHQRARGWTYRFFLDRDILDFFRLNPIADFPNIEGIFHRIRTGAHKADLFRYYYMYINGGVFLDSDAMFQMNLDDIIRDYDFVTVIGRDESSYFNGFIACMPKSIIMYEAIKNIYYADVNMLAGNYMYIVRQFKKIVDKHRNRIKHYLYREKGPWVGHMNSVDEGSHDRVIFTHYYKSKVVPR